MSVPFHKCAGHLSRLVPPEKMRATVELALKFLERYEYDTLAFSGLSGFLLGPVLCYLTGKEMIAVRKPGDNTHSFYTVEGNKNAERYIIVDDFIGSGETVRRIENEVKNFAPEAICLGVLESFYLGDEWARGRGLSPIPKEWSMSI